MVLLCSGVSWPHLDLVPLGVVLDQDVARLRVVVLVEGVLSARPDEANRLARLQGGHTVLIGVHDRRAGHPVGDVLDLRVVDLGVRAVGRDHGERRHDDPVVEVQRRAALLVLRRVGEGRGRSVQVGEELAVRWAGEAVAEVDTVVVRDQVADADRRAHLLEPDRVDGRRSADERDALAVELLDLAEVGAGGAERLREDDVGVEIQHGRDFGAEGRRAEVDGEVLHRLAQFGQRVLGRIDERLGPPTPGNDCASIADIIEELFATA